MICYVSIGNSDDKLSQREWSKFVRDVDAAMFVVVNHGGQMHGRWLSAADAPWQNACWCVETDEESPLFVDAEDGPSVSEWLKRELRRLAADYRQDSIKWASVAQAEDLSYRVGTDE